MSNATAPAPPEPAFGPETFQARTGASPRAMAELERYRELLADWNQRLNLVGPSALADFWLRHAFDSAQLLGFEPNARRWADLGAGAGFPGVVLAILGRDNGLRVDLVDSQLKRCRFLQAVAEQLALPVEVHHARAEAFRRRDVDVVTARALAPLPRLLTYAEPLLAAGATGLFLKGRDVELELTEARKHWTFQCDLTPSLSDSSGRVLKLWRLKRV
jgi:16S rRNA (guanine527-N7)-methyltransferase